MIFSAGVCVEIALWGTKMAAVLQVCALVFSYQALCLNGSGDIHQGFQALLTEVNRSGSQYVLRTANRLFGEKTCDFFPVSCTCASMLKKLKIK